MGRYLVYAFMEAASSLWRSRVLNLLSIGTIMFAMFILGSFVFVGANLKKLTIDWQERIQFNVFLRDDIDEAQRAAVAQLLEESMMVDRVVFISKEEARHRFGNEFSAYEEALASMDDNPFPASFQVTLLEGAGGASFRELRDALRLMTGVEEVYYDEDIFRRLDYFADLIQLTGWFFGGIMIFSSIFTISNVLKLTFFTRREEVDIMKLVGASRAYIRGPFIVEGVLIGILGAALGVLILFFSYLALDFYITRQQAVLLGGLDLTFLSLRWIALLLVAGAISGLFGSLVSLRQFLDEHISYQ